MVRSYLRHGETKAFGIVCSSGSNSLYDGKLAYVPALEDVLVWDMKKSEMVAMWHETGHRSEVTCIARSASSNLYAVGYMDGSIRLWDSSTSSTVVAFNGHDKAVTALAFDSDGSRLVSGSQDTQIIVWDVLAETGMFRLRGHRDQITTVKFITSANTSSTAPSTSTAGPLSSGYILTASKDTLMKLWDLSTQHCVQTVVAHRSEVWTMAMDADEDIVLTGGSDGELKAWRIDHEALQKGISEDASGEIRKMIQAVGQLPLSSKSRVSSIAFHPRHDSDSPYFAVQSHDKSVEIFRVRTVDEVKRKQARKTKRAKEKAASKGAKADDPLVAAEAENKEENIEMIDLFNPYLIVRGSGKIRSFAFVDEEPTGKGEVQIFLALASNALEVFRIPALKSAKGTKNAAPEASHLYSVDIPGHRTDIRAICVSSDDQVIASASNGTLKIWNVKTTACVRTMECGYALCISFLPGDRHVVVGTKAGDLEVFDIATSSMFESVKAHEGACWGLQTRPNGRGLVTGGADKDVKFWEFEDEIVDGKSQTKLAHTKTLKMTDDVLAVKYTPNGKLLAVALLDSTVKIFYADTLKFFLSLYGHKLPVLSLDISTDSKLIATSSADKNVKIWGLDFGDCHRSLFAHSDSIMQVAFERTPASIGGSSNAGDPNAAKWGGHSHYLWTASKDKMLKYIDGDKFDTIQQLKGHHGEIWAMAVSNRGEFVVTGSHDKSIRVWEKTEDQVFLEEEREKEIEAIHEAGIADTLNKKSARIGSGVEGAEPQEEAEGEMVSRQTAETLMSGEKIMEAIDVADAERNLFAAYNAEVAESEDPNSIPLPARNPMLEAFDLTPEAHVLKTVEKVRNAELYDALLVLPFAKVVSLLEYLSIWAKKEWNTTLVARLMFFLLKTHHHQIVSNRIMRPTLLELRTRLRSTLKRQKEEISYNLAGLKFIRRANEASLTNDFYAEAENDEDSIRSRLAALEKKRKRVSIKA